MSDELILEIDPPYIGSAVSPTVDITETTTDVTVTITDYLGDHAYTVEKTDQAIADAEQAATNANTAAANATSTANQAAQYARQTADQAAADAQATADAAAGRADTAAGGANQAAQAATAAAGTANTSAQNADAKAALADSKAGLANQAATTANQAAQAAEAAKTAANTAAGQATTAATNATTAAQTATTAATNADAKAQLANTAATNADTATQAANTATTNATNAAQAANNAADVAIEAAETITDGYFPKMLAGAAESLMDETDTATFAERMSTHDGVARIEAIQGNTVVWNQLVSEPNDATNWRKTVGTTNVTIEVENKALKITVGDVSSGGNSFVISASLGANYISGHKYMLKAHTSSTNILSHWNLLDVWAGGTAILPNTQGVQSIIATATATSANSPYAAITFMPQSTPAQSVGTVIYIYSISCIDLTRMFGAGNEPATVAEFEAMFPADYYPYSAGELLSVNIEGVNDREIPAATYFPDGVKSAGSIHDELTMGKAVKRVGSVDLGTLNWNYDSGNTRFYALVNGMTTSSVGGWTDKLACAIYTPNLSPITSQAVDKTIARYSNACVYIVNKSYTDTATFKAAMSGVMLCYELAAPVETEITPPLTMTYTVEQGGTESIVIPTGEQSAAPTMAIVYGLTADGVVDKALSVIAPIEGATASTNYSVNAYLVHNQQLYRVTSAIATGESITPGTNCIACTVMGELARLTA